MGAWQADADVNYRLQEILTDPRNLQTNYQMDKLGNLLSQASPDTGSTQNTFDEAGNLKTRTDARGKAATYSYDSQDRITQMTYEDQTITYTWDTCTNGIGRICSLANADSTVTINYDTHGRVTSKTQTIGTVTQNTAYRYNAAGTNRSAQRKRYRLCLAE